jgi:ATP-dependent Clp protease ATP-binding subunit ClpA
MNTLTNHGTQVELTPAKPYPLLGLTPRAHRLHGIASAAAKARGDRFVGVEHILIAIIRSQQGVAAALLEQHGVTEELILSHLSDPL